MKFAKNGKRIVGEFKNFTAGKTWKKVCKDTNRLVHKNQKYETT